MWTLHTVILAPHSSQWLSPSVNELLPPLIPLELGGRLKKWIDVEGGLKADRDIAFTPPPPPMARLSRILCKSWPAVKLAGFMIAATVTWGSEKVEIQWWSWGVMGNTCSTVTTCVPYFLPDGILICQLHGANRAYLEAESRSFLPLIEPEGSLPCSQQPPTGPVESSPHPHILFNNILPSMPTCPKWSLTLNLPDQNFVCMYHLPHACYTPRPSHPAWFHHPNNAFEEQTLWSSSLFQKSRDSSVGIALGYGQDDRGSRVRFPAGAGNFSLHHRVQNGCGAHPSSYPMDTGALSLG
jgi:hypothetical protein